MGKFTGLVGVVELLIFWIFGTGGGGGVLLPPPPQPTAATDPMAPKTNKPNRCVFLRMIVFSFSPLILSDRSSPSTMANVQPKFSFSKSHRFKLIRRTSLWRSVAIHHRNGSYQLKCSRGFRMSVFCETAVTSIANLRILESRSYSLTKPLPAQSHHFFRIPGWPLLALRVSH
jgi:hypothetical protein